MYDEASQMTAPQPAHPETARTVIEFLLMLVQSSERVGCVAWLGDVLMNEEGDGEPGVE